MQDKRIYLWDNLKFLLIALVVLGHAIDGTRFPMWKSIYLFIYSFHMPLFIFISGLFHKNEDILKKALTYFAIGSVLKLLIYITRTYICGDHVKLYWLQDSSVPWFMFVIGVFVVVTYVLRFSDHKTVLIITLAMGCFAGYDKTLGDYLYLSRIVVFYPFYYLGSIINKDRLNEYIHEKENEIAIDLVVKITSLVLVVIWGMLCIYKIDSLYILRHLFTGRNYFKSEIIEFGCFYRMLTYLITFALGLALISLVPNRRLPIISEFGKRTIQVFFWHRPILYVLDSLEIESLLQKGIVGDFLYLAIYISLPFILSTKLFSEPTNYLLKARHTSWRLHKS